MTFDTSKYKDQTITRALIKEVARDIEAYLMPNFIHSPQHAAAAVAEVLEELMLKFFKPES